MIRQPSDKYKSTRLHNVSISSPERLRRACKQELYLLKKFPPKSLNQKLLQASRLCFVGANG